MKIRDSFITALLIALLFTACTNNQHEGHGNNENKFGGILKMNEAEPLKTLFPPKAKDIVSSHIISQVYEGLVKYDLNNLSIIPAIAKKWEIDPTGTIYTFSLRRDVFFHDDPCFPDGVGRRVTAEDFRFSFELLSTQSDDNMRFKGTIDHIKGAREYYDASAMGKPNFNIEGINVINDSTLQITIEEPNSIYIYLLADISAVAIPKEGYEKYGDKNYVGAGPFRLNEHPDGLAAIHLLRNQNYYKKDSLNNHLPYLDSVKISFVSSTKKELGLLEKGKIDIITGLTDEYVSQFLAKNITQFEGNPPVFIIDGSDDFADYELFNIRSSKVNNFFSNRMNIIDLSIVYLAEPKTMDSEELEKNKK